MIQATPPKTDAEIRSAYAVLCKSLPYLMASPQRDEEYLAMHQGCLALAAWCLGKDDGRFEKILRDLRHCLAVERGENN